MRKSKKTGEEAEIKLNIEHLKLVGATCLACAALFYVYSKWSRIPQSTPEDSEPAFSQSASAGPGTPGATGYGDDFPAAEIQKLLGKSDAEGLKKLLDKGGSRRDAWCVRTIQTAISLKPKMSLGFVFDGLENRLSHAGSLKYEFDAAVNSAVLMGSADLLTDILVHVKNLDPARIKTKNFELKTVTENLALREAILKICGSNMPQDMMTGLMMQCKAPQDWEVLKEMLKVQDITARSYSIMHVYEARIKQEDPRGWSIMLDLCDQQSLTRLVQNTLINAEISSAQIDILSDALKLGAKIEFHRGESERLRAKAPELWKRVIDQLSSEQLTNLWWEEMDSDISADALRHWGDKLPLVMNLTKRNFQNQSITGLEMLMARQSWEACEFLVKQNAKLPNIEESVNKLFLQMATGKNKDLQATLKAEKEKRGNWPSPTGDKYLLDMLHSAIRLGQAEACGQLAKSLANAGPNDSVLYAIEKNQWECLQQILNNGHELQNDEVRLMSQKSPERLDNIISNLGTETSPKNMMIIIDGVIEVNDKDRLSVALMKLRTFSEKSVSENQSTSLEKLVGANAVKRTVGLALPHPELLATLQLEGFPIDFADLLRSLRDGNLKSTEICLRSILMMKLSEEDYKELNEVVSNSPSHELKQLFRDLVLN